MEWKYDWSSSISWRRKLIQFSLLLLFIRRKKFDKCTLSNIYHKLPWKSMQFFQQLFSDAFWFFLKFIYSDKVTKFCEISTVDLSHVVPVKSTVEILWPSQNIWTLGNDKMFRRWSTAEIDSIQNWKYDRAFKC